MAKHSIERPPSQVNWTIFARSPDCIPSNNYFRPISPPLQSKTGRPFADHLGSTSLTLDASGTKIGEMKYYPFGEMRYTWGGTPTDRLFTGQRADSYINLYEMGARQYDPAIGRWLSPDTIVPDPANPQSLNRYSYVYNSPLNFTDPSGHCPKNERLCEIIVKNVKDTYGIVLQDDTAIWSGGEARWVEDTLSDLARNFALVNNISIAQGAAMVKKIWQGVTMYRMHSTNNFFGGDIAWTPPSDGGMRIEIPDATANNGLWSQNAKKWTQHILAEELGHSWDSKTGGALYLNGYDGGPLSRGLVSAVKAKVGGECFTFLACFSYSSGPEPTVDGFKGHAAMSPVEDWGGSFAQFNEYTSQRKPVSPLRAQYVRIQMSLAVVNKKN